MPGRAGPPFSEVDFASFHESELPGRVGANGARAFAASRSLGALGLRIPEGHAYTYEPRDGTIAVRSGTERAETLVEIEPQDFSDLTHDLASAPGLLYGGRVQILRGESRRFLDWEPAWRALFHGREVYDRRSIDLRDRRGAALDPARRFDADDDPADIAHFLRAAGYVVVRGVFRPDEIAHFRAAGRALASAASEDDGNSWWGITAGGEKRLTRVLDCRSKPELQSLTREPRLTQLVDLFDPKLEPDVRGEAVTYLWKLPNVIEGLANLPWHRDCGMGGHAVQCPTLNVSVFLTRANRKSGGLWMLPGSAAFSCPSSLFAEDEPPGSILLEAEPGDVSLHSSDTMHAAFPPTGAGEMRESLIVTWKPPGARPHDGQHHYNDAVKGQGGVPVAGRAPFQK